MDRRASEGGERERTDYAGPWITQGHGPTTQRTRIDNDTGRHNKRIYTYECKQITDQGITTRYGHGLDTSEQGGEQVPMPVRYNVRKGGIQVGGAAGRTRTILETARASSKPCNGKLWSRKQRARTEREAPKSVRQHFVLSTRDAFLFVVLFLL